MISHPLVSDFWAKRNQFPGGNTRYKYLFLPRVALIQKWLRGIVVTFKCLRLRYDTLTDAALALLRKLSILILRVMNENATSLS